MFQRVSGTRRCSHLETAIGDFSGGYMNKTNDCLMIGSYVCGLNSELFLHTDKNHNCFALREMQKSICILTLYLFMFALNLFLHRFSNELARSLSNKWKTFSSINYYIII